MAIDYTLNWTDNSAKPPFILAGSTVDTTTTSLALTGKGYVNWGERLQENLLHLLENFAYTSPPPNPTVGQLWYNTGADLMMVYSTDSLWVALTGTPTPTPTPTPAANEILTTTPTSVVFGDALTVTVTGGLPFDTFTATNTFDSVVISIGTGTLDAFGEFTTGDVFSGTGASVGTIESTVVFAGTGHTRVLTKIVGANEALSSSIPVPVLGDTITIGIVGGVPLDSFTVTNTFDSGGGPVTTSTGTFALDATGSFTSGSIPLGSTPGTFASTAIFVTSGNTRSISLVI